MITMQGTAELSKMCLKSMGNQVLGTKKAHLWGSIGYLVQNIGHCCTKQLRVRVVAGRSIVAVIPILT